MTTRTAADTRPAARTGSAELVMSGKTFQMFSAFIEENLGIKMPDVKKTMLQTRLLKRMRRLDIDTFEDYADYVFSPEGRERELRNMFDVVTTNKTDFFREAGHFDFLVDEALPDLIRRYGTGVRQPALFWSAGCSTGEEPYTLAMVLSEYSRKVRDFKFSILGTDISTRVLEKAKSAIYDEEDVAPVAMELKKRYLLRSRDRKKRLVRIAPELRAAARFYRLNFMDPSYGIRQRMDVVFCRNVIIYFDKATQKQVLSKILSHLRTGGYLFSGHSETLNDLGLPIAPVKSTIYRKRA